MKRFARELLLGACLFGVLALVFSGPADANDPGFVMHPSSRAGGSITGGFEISGDCAQDPTGVVCCHDKQGLRCGWPPTDAIPAGVYLYSYSAGPLSTGGNQTGGDLTVAGGLGIRTFVMTNGTCTAADKITVTVDGAASDCVEGTDFDCDGLTDAQCATNAVVCVAAVSGVDACAGVACLTVDGFTGVTTTIYVWRTTGGTVVLADTGGCATVTNGTDGVVAISGAATVGSTLVATGAISTPSTVTATGGLIANSDTNGLCLGAVAATCTDWKQNFDGVDCQNTCDGDLVQNSPMVVGPTRYLPKDSSMGGALDMNATAGGAGDPRGYCLNGGNNCVQRVYWESDGGVGTQTHSLRAFDVNGDGMYWREFHAPAAKSSPGGSGATLVVVNTSTLVWLLDATTEFLYFSADVHADWDGASDIVVEVTVALDAAETNGDDIEAEVVCEYAGEHDDMDTNVRTQTRTVNHDIGTDSEQGKKHELIFIIDWDLASHTIVVHDEVECRFRLDAQTTVNSVWFFQADLRYRTSKPERETGGTFPSEG